MTRLTLSVCLLSSTLALAQGKPTLVDYPLDLKVSVGAELGKDLQTHLRMTLARSPAILVVTNSDWKAAVAALKRQDCDIRDECLQQLATKAGTLYALYASVERNAQGNEITATGRVVNEDGAQVRSPVRATVKKTGSFADAAKEALSQLVTKLDLDTLPAAIAKAAPVVTPPATVMVVSPLPPKQPVADAPLTGQRIAAWATLGGAAVCGGVTAFYGFSSLGKRQTLPSDGHLTQEQVATQQSVNQGATIALATGIGAVALLVVSATLFVTEPTEPSATVTVSPTNNGAALLLSGRF